MADDIIRHLCVRSSRIMFWLAACSGAAWLIGQAIDWGGRVHPEPGIHPVKSVAPARLPKTNRAQASGSYPVSTEYPVFDVSPPPAPEPTSEPQGVTKKDLLQLTGTAIFGDSKRAVLLESVSGAVQVVAEGDMINGVLVERIDHERITLSMADGREHLDVTGAPAIAGACSGTGAPCSDAAAAEPAPSETTLNAIEPRTAELRAARAQRRLARAAARSTR